MSVDVLERDQATDGWGFGGIQSVKNAVDVIFTIGEKAVWQDRRLGDYFKN